MKNFERVKSTEYEKKMDQLIYQLEIELLNPLVRKSPDRLKQLLSDDFIEFGTSGKIFNKQDVIQSLLVEEEQVINLKDFKVMKLSEDIILATYKAIIEGVPSLRSSIWRRKDSEWKMIFHQGTKCETKV